MAEGGLKVTRKEPKDIWVRGLETHCSTGVCCLLAIPLSLPFFLSSLIFPCGLSFLPLYRFPIPSSFYHIYSSLVSVPLTLPHLLSLPNSVPSSPFPLLPSCRRPLRGTPSRGCISALPWPASGAQLLLE